SRNGSRKGFPSRQAGRIGLPGRGLSSIRHPKSPNHGYEWRANESQDQHRIAERVEAITLLDRELVEAPRLLDAGERHHEREQGRARQVEVRQQVVDAPKAEARGDEKLRPPRE